jgi:hypothetical protein
MSEHTETDTITIANRYNRHVLFEAEMTFVSGVTPEQKRGAAVCLAVRKCAFASLVPFGSEQSASLLRVDLREADLRDGPDLRGIDMLKGATVVQAQLIRANLDFEIATPEQAAPRIRAVAKAVFEAVEEEDGVFGFKLQEGVDWADREEYKSCGPFCSIGGCAVHLAGERGEALVDEFGWHLAALSLLGHEAAEHFCDDHEAATAWLRSYAGDTIEAGEHLK